MQRGKNIALLATLLPGGLLRLLSVLTAAVALFACSAPDAEQPSQGREKAREMTDSLMDIMEANQKEAPARGGEEDPEREGE